MIIKKFRTKLLLVAVAPVIIASIILAYTLISGRVDEFNKRIDEQGNNIASYLSSMSEYGVFSNNFEYLEPILAHTLRQKNIVAVYIEDQNNSVVLKNINKNYKDINIKNIDKTINKEFSSSIIKTSLVLDDIYDSPDVSSSTMSAVGRVNVVMNLNDVKLLKRKIIQNGIVTTFILTLVTIIIVLLFSRSVTKPINRIYRSIKIIKKGDLQHRIPVNFSGELAVLANGINDMTSSLETSKNNDQKRKQELINAKEDAERANRSKSLFLSSMSHEMRTPLNAVLGFAQIIEMDANDEITKDNVKEIMNASRHLLGLIEDLLAVSEIESSNIKLWIESYELKNIIDSCLPMIKSLAEKMLVKIDNKVDILPSINVYVDEKRFKQVLLNLLTNAVKYNKKNGSVVIDYSIDGEQMLCLSIMDTGKGIEPTYNKQIFNYFDRAGQEASTIAGSGMGLAISKKLIEKMNGTIGFESVHGEGTHFWIKVPLKKEFKESDYQDLL